VRLLLVRHGQTQYNADRRVQGQIDIPLNDVGRWQAERIGARLSRYSPTMILSSDLSRAAETARAIADHHQTVPFQQSELLREVGYGVFEGLNGDDIVEKYPEEFRLWQEDRNGYMPPEAETIHEQRFRAAEAAKLIMEQGSEGDTIVVVSHGAIMRSLMATFMNLEIEQQVNLHFDNTSLTALERGQRGMVLRLSNDTSHLGDQAIFP
jgi:broad specificity phosphatase PhoE